jgi:hypothetical protein
VTNVPGPPIHIYSSGARLESMALSLICLTDGLGLAHVVQSYVDEAYISFTACRDIMPDPDVYAACIQESFDEMLAAAKDLGTTSAAKPAAKPAAKAAPVKTGPTSKSGSTPKRAATTKKPQPKAKPSAPVKTGATRKSASAKKKPARRKPAAKSAEFAKKTGNQPAKK